MSYKILVYDPDKNGNFYSLYENDQLSAISKAEELLDNGAIFVQVINQYTCRVIFESLYNDDL